MPKGTYGRVASRSGLACKYSIDVGAGSLPDKMVHFYAKGESYPNLVVGTMSDPSDESTFTAYETLLMMPH